MKNSLFLLLLCALTLFAREELTPVEKCPAFNNMKHSKNTHSVLLDISRRYTILDHHKGQYLIVIKGEQPAQRWVDESCFEVSENTKSSLDNYIDTVDETTEKTNNTKKYNNSTLSQNNLLALSWHNAFCETHRNKKECRRNMFSLYKSKHKETHFILHGLWPQPAGKAYCGVKRKYITMDKYKQWNKLPALNLSHETKVKLTKIMPGVYSNLHRHEWYKHGTCYGTDEESYFKKAIGLVEEFHKAEVSKFFEKNIGKRVTLKQIRNMFDRDFGTGAGKSVALRCKNGLVTELWLNLAGESESLGILLREGKAVQSRCKYGTLDRAGFTKETNHRIDFGR